MREVANNVFLHSQEKMTIKRVYKYEMIRFCGQYGAHFSFQFSGALHSP